MKPRIVFVDDEALVLQGLQRMLHGMRQEWDMEFVESGELALECLSRGPVDAVVSDMRMPGMSGAELLKQVMQRYPRSVRIVLSGQAEEDLFMKSVGVAHQYLAKPSSADAIKAALSRAFTAGISFNNPRLKEVVCRIERLPSIPAVFFELVEQMKDPAVDLSQIAATISRDIAMTAKILKLVNSAYFGLQREISEVGEAVAYLGINTIKTLVLTVHAFSRFEGPGEARLRLDRLWSHSLSVAGTARGIAAIEQAPAAVTERAFIAGMLHDIGQLVLSASLGEAYIALVERAESEGKLLCEAEAAELGTTHAEVGGYLLGLWALPAPVVEAVALHHQPRGSLAEEFSALTAVHAAEVLHPLAAEVANTHSQTGLDLEYLARLGLSDRWAVWEEAAVSGIKA